MSTAQVVESSDNLPVAQVLNSEKFLGQALITNLQAKNLRVITDTHSHFVPDYIFYFSASASEINKTITAFPQNTRLLIAYPFGISIDALAIFSTHPNLRLVCLPPHLYGPNINLKLAGILGQLLVNIRRQEPLRISGDGFEKVYPTHITDLVDGLTKAMFSSGSSGKIYFLINPQPISLLNLTYLLRQIAPGRQLIEFSETSPQKDLKLPPGWQDNLPELHWHPQVDLVSGLKQTLNHAAPPPPLDSDHDQPQNISLIEESPLKIELPKLKFKSRRFMVVLLIVLLFFWAIFAPVFEIFIGISSLANSQKSFLSGKLDQSLIQAHQSNTNFSRTRNHLNFFSSTIGHLFLSDLFLKSDKILSAFQQLSVAQADLIQASKIAVTIPPSSLGQTNTNPLSALVNTRLQLQQVKLNLNLAKAELSKPRPRLQNLSLFRLGESFTKFTTDITKSLQAVSDAESLTQLALHIFSGPKKTYLILLQNSAELRPTGGFIDGLAFLTVDSGRILDLEFVNVYTADSQLQGLVEPPSPIKSYLGETGWYLRDSNWDPHFPATARQAEWFVNHELNRQIQGTIAINLYFVKHILEAMGPITPASLNQPITASNLFERAQNYHQIDLSDTSTSRPDIISDVLQSVYAKLPTFTPAEWLKLGHSLLTSLNHRQLIISIASDPAVTPLISDKHWDGGLTPISLSCSPANFCYQDYLAIREANLGINKANLFILRNIHYKLKAFKEDNLTATLLLNYNNSSPSEAWPAGTYKNYLRLYLPLGSQIKQVTINSVSLPLTQIDQSVQHSLTVVGFLVSVPPQHQSSVQVTYQLPGQLIFNDQHHTFYHLYISKQSGTDKDPLTVNLTLPPYLRLLESQPTREPIPGAITFLTDLSTDRLFTLELEK